MHRFGISLLILVLLSASCTPAVRVAQPLQFAEEPATLKREKASAAVVLNPGLAPANAFADKELAARVGKALAEGFAEASKAVFERVGVAEKPQEGDWDFLITPANFYLEKDASGAVDISLDVKILRTKDRKEFGMLVKGRGAPAPRPFASVNVGGQTLQFTGVHLPNGSYGRALNNALFDITVDYLKGLDRRIESLRNSSR